MFTTAELKEQIKNNTIVLSHGAHTPDSGECCLLEAVAILCDEPWSDAPRCACPVASAFARRLNDRMNDKDRQLLVPFIARLDGSKSSRKVTRERAFIATDWAVREAAPFALEKRGRRDLADKLRAIAPIMDVASAQAARATTAEVRSAAAYADAAAYAAYADAAAAYAAARAADDAAAAAAAYADAAAAAAAAAAYAAYADAAAAADAARSAWYRDHALPILDKMLSVKE